MCVCIFSEAHSRLTHIHIDRFTATAPVSACFKAAAEGPHQLFRMQGQGMDVVATKDHRMLVARRELKTEKLVDKEPFVYQTVEDLLSLQHSANPSAVEANEGDEQLVQLNYIPERALVRSGLNAQPHCRVTIPGLEATCDWCGSRTISWVFLRFCGFWLRHGHLNITDGQAGVRMLAAFCRDRVSRPCYDCKEQEEYEGDEKEAAPSSAVVWNGGVWDIRQDDTWYYRKRWMGPNVSTSIANLSQKQAVALLDGCFRADGAGKTIRFDADGEPTRQWTCSHSSFPLIDHLQLIGQLAGAQVELSRIINQGKKGNGLQGRVVETQVEQWLLTLSFSPIWGAKVPLSTLARPVPVDATDGAGYYGYEPGPEKYVYDLTVEDNHNFLTQRLSIKTNKTVKGAESSDVQAHPVFVGNCFNTLDLPEYSTMDVMRTKLMYAINEGSQGVGFR